MSDAPQSSASTSAGQNNRQNSNTKGKGRANAPSTGAGPGGSGGSKRPRGSKKPSRTQSDHSSAAAPSQTVVPESSHRIRRDYEPDFEPLSDEACFICAEPVAIFALPPCNHRTCHVCSVRLRALYKKTACTFCNQDTGALPVVFTRDPDKAYQDFVPLLGLDKLSLSDETEKETASGDDDDSTKIQLLKGGKDDKLGIHFEEPQLRHFTLALLAFNCPDPGCKVVCKGWTDLKSHAKQSHDRCLCEMCLKFVKIFAHEHLLFTQAQLRVHIERGDVNISDQKGFTGHPQCEFCRSRFYDNEALFGHLRKQHEQCFICVRNRSGRDQFFLNYQQLEQHFEQAHFTCSAQVCRDTKFVVFETAMDLQQHEMEVHGEALSHTTKRAMKEARRLQLDFSYGGGSSSNQASTSAESSTAAATAEADRRARAREMFASRDESGAESSDAASGARRRNVPGLPAAGSSSSRTTRGGRAGFSGQLSSTEEARKQKAEAEQRARHAAVMERVSTLVGNSEPRLSAFKTAVRTYRAGECSAEDLLSTMWSMFDSRLSAMTEIVTELAEILDMPDKARTLLQAWESFNVSDSFPALASGSGSRSTAVAPANRPRKAAVSSRGQRSNDIWSRVQQAADTAGSRSAAHYPALPTSAARPAGGQGARATPWAASGSNGSNANATNKNARPALTPHSVSFSGRPTNSGRSTPARPPNGLDFPSLPSSAQAAAKAAQMREIFNRDMPSPAGWGAPSASGTPSGSSTPVEAFPPADTTAGGGGKKKNKQKKQLLFSVTTTGH